MDDDFLKLSAEAVSETECSNPSVCDYWITPVYKNLEYFYGQFEIPRQFPFEFVAAPESGLATFCKENVCEDVSEAFRVGVEMIECRVNVPLSPDVCAVRLLDFVGEIFLTVRFDGKETALACGSIFLPIGMFVSDARRGTAHFLIDGKEKVLTFSESIISDYPYLVTDKKGGKQRYSTVRATDAAEEKFKICEEGYEKLHDQRQLFDRDASKSATAVDKAVRCTYKSFYVSSSKIDLSVESDGSVVVNKCEPQVTDERVTANVNEIVRMMRKKWNACMRGHVPITNNNDYCIKVLSTPIEMVTGYWSKCISKEIRRRRDLADFSIVNLKKMLEASSPFKLKRMLKCGKASFFQEDRAWNKEKSTQMVDPENPFAGRCQEYRVVPSYHKTTKQTYMRQIHSSQYGMICPVLTPDGSNIGMIRHLAHDVRLSVYAGRRSQRRGKSLVTSAVSTFESAGGDDVLVIYNNVPVGWVRDWRSVALTVLREFPSAGVHKDAFALYVYHGMAGHLEKRIGNAWRNVRTVWTFKELFVCNIRNLFHPIVIFQKYYAHNEGPRNTLACGMMKQATTENDRGTRVFNSDWKHLYGGAPILDEAGGLCCGEMVKCLVFPHEDAQEDSFVVSRNMTNTKFIRINEKTTVHPLPPGTSLENDRVRQSRAEEALRALQSTSSRRKQVSKRLRVHERNVVCLEPGALLKAGEPYVYSWTAADVLVPLAKLKQNTGGFRFKSVEVVPGSSSLVRCVLSRELRIGIGDKLQTRHGNKGVVSHILEDDRMLRTDKGEVIDVYIHPAPLIKRQQMGHVVEASARGGPRVETIVDPRTGYVFGPMEIHEIYMFALKQLARDKAHVRTPGVVLPLTRQPPEGKANNGGCKLGEMEVHSLLSTGATDLLTKTLRIPKHETTMWHCEECGEAYEYDFLKLHEKRCGSSREMTPFKVRYCYTILRSLTAALMRKDLVLSSR